MAWLTSLVAVSAVSASDLTSIVCEGDNVPDVPGAQVTSVQVFAINDAEDVVGELSYSGGSMIFRGNPTGSTLEKVVAVGDVVSGAGLGSATVSYFQDAQVASNGQVLVTAGLDVGGSFPERAVLFGTPGNLTVQAYRGGSIAGFNINNIHQVEMNRSGTIAFSVGIDDGSTFTTGIWQNGVLIAKPGVHYTGLPAGEGFVAISTAARLNDAGELVLSATTEPLGGGSLRSSIWIRNVGGVYEQVMEVFRPEDIPGLPDGSNLQSPGVKTFASGPMTGFTAFISGTGITFSNDFGWFVHDGSTIKLIAQEGTAAPGVAGAVFPQAANGFDVDAMGRAMLLLRLPTGGDINSSNDKGVWVWDGTALTLKIREGDAAPGAPGHTIGTIDSSRLTSDGQLLVQASVSGASTVFRGSVTGGLQPIAGPGFTLNAPVDPTTVEHAGYGANDPNHSEGSPQSASASGLVAMEVFLPGSIECVAVNLAPPTGPGTISGEVRVDVDGDVEDTPFDGVILRLYADDGTGTVTPTGLELDSLQAGGDGFYEFTNVTPGTYVVEAELTPAAAQSGYVVNAPANKRRLAVVSAGNTESGRDFLCTIPAVITALAVNDAWLEGSQTDRSPLTPSTDTAVLLPQPDLQPGGGLCADGVTPFVFRILVNQLPLDQPLRWECEVLSGGSIVGGIYPQMRALVSGAWQGASEAGPNIAMPISPGQTGAGTAFVSLFPLRPDQVLLDTPDRELQIELRVFNATTGDLMAKSLTPVKVRRPPVFLIASSPAETWEDPFLDALKTSRAADFIRELSFESTEAKFDAQFGFYYDMAEVLADLQWDSEVSTIRQQWAMTHPDVVSHGNGAEFVMGMSLSQGLSNDFRSSANFHRGRFRNAVTVGAPLVTRIGLLKSYANLMDQAIRKQGLAGVAEVGHLPETLKKVRGWSSDPRDLPARIRLTQNINVRKVYDELAPFHLIGTKIDPMASQLFRQIGFTTQAQALLTPNGTDGVVAVEDALLGFRGFESESLMPPLISHGEDTGLFGGAPKQTASDAVGQRTIFMLDQTGGSTFLNAAEIDSARSSLTFRETDALREIMDYLIEQTLRPDKVATLIEILGGSPAPPESGASEPASFTSPPPGITYTIELQEAAGESLTAGPWWYAEVFGPGGVTPEGVTLTPDGGNPYRVDVTVDDGTVGDVVLYATYEVSNGVVFATPIRVVSNEPASATAQSITVEPDGVVLDLGDEVRPEVTVHYSDGSSSRRWITSDDVTVSSSLPGVLNVDEELVWTASGVGTAAVTLNFGALSDQVSIQVVNRDVPQTYAGWRGGVFNASELSNPLISGDTADIDLDGLNTFMEYITGGDPLVFDFNQLPRLTTVNTGPGPRPALVFRISKRVSGEDIDLEESGDLATWSDLIADLGTTPSEGGDVLAIIEGETFHEFWIDVGNPLTGRQFYRLGINNDTTPPLTATGTTEFTFGGFSQTGYGDRVTGTTDGSFVYGGEAGFSPNIEAVFVGFTSPWNTGFGDLQHATYASSGGPLRIDLVADFGFAVQLEHFDLAGYGADHTIDSVEIQDGSGAVLWSQQNLVAPGASHARLDFSGLNLVSNILTIVVDGTNISGGSDEVGLDNLQFKQVPTATLGNWSMLTFESGQSSYVDLDASYGQRITSATMGSFSYVGAGSFTPGIVVDYLPAGSMVHAIGDYGLLQHVVYKNDFFATPFEIQLSADAGQEVQLLGFDLAGYSPSDYMLNSVKVLDDVNGELFSELNFHVAGERTRVDFSGAPLRSRRITIQIDSTNLGSSSDNVAIDNISFEQVAAP